MSEIEELKQKYRKAIEDARRTYVADLKDLLAKHNLDGKVVRKSDGKLGWIDVSAYDGGMTFHAVTKKGKKSLSSSGWFYEGYVFEFFEPCKEGRE